MACKQRPGRLGIPALQDFPGREALEQLSIGMAPLNSPSRTLLLHLLPYTAWRRILVAAYYNAIVIRDIIEHAHA